MTRWTEVADGVYRQRYNPLDIGICVIRGADGLGLVDTGSSHRQADQIRADLTELAGPVLWVVNTHAHYDHTFGNARFGPGSDLDLPIYAHELAPAHLDTYERPMLARWVAERLEPVEEWAEVVITPPTEVLGDHATLHLGDRVVKLWRHGRGHTDHDLVLHLPHAATWLLGDLLEESGPPCYGSGSFPLEWPDTMTTILDSIEDGDLVVPGHGAVVDRAFAAAQQAELAEVARLLRELHAAGVDRDDAVRAGGDRWPFPADGIAGAVRDGFRQLDEP